MNIGTCFWRLLLLEFVISHFHYNLRFAVNHSIRLYIRSVIQYLFNVNSFVAPAFTSFVSSYFSLNDNRRLFVLSDIVLTYKLFGQKHLRSRWHCHRTKVHTDTVGTARSVVTLLLDLLARPQRLSLTLQTPRLRIPPTYTLNQVLSVFALIGIQKTV